MLIFISGGVRSGKSSLGESLVLKYAKERKVYLATAQAYDDEMQARINKHQLDRAGKGFTTLEKSRNISLLADSLQHNDTVLLDCLGTLLANEMFADHDKKIDTCFMDHLVEKLLKEIDLIKNAVFTLIIVSNEIFSDGKDYTLPTRQYIEVLGRLHVRLADMSDAAVECAYHNYIVHKGGIL